MPLNRTGSFDDNISDDGSKPQSSTHEEFHHDYDDVDKPLEKPVLVYHECARSIVFRDQLRRAAVHEEQQQQQQQQQQQDNDDGSLKKATTTEPTVDTSHFNSAHSTDTNSSHSYLGAVRPYAAAAVQPLSAAAQFADTLLELAEPPHHIDTTSGEVQIAGFQPKIVPLPSLELGPNDEFLPLLDSHTPNDQWSDAEKEVFEMLQRQQAVVKTIKNTDWTDFLKRFLQSHDFHRRGKGPQAHNDIAQHGDYQFNSFVTSTSLLPENGLKMRAFGSTTLYRTGVVFALPTSHGSETEQEAAARTATWSWPAGYSAKTEFNIDSYGNLINGRKEALVSLAQLREFNDDYIHKEDYMVGHRLVKGGFKLVPYNEIFLRVGGVGRIVRGKDVATAKECRDDRGKGRSLEFGVGLPVALFVRMPTYGHLMSLMRARARLLHVLGEPHFAGIPLLLITPELGVRVMTESLQRELLKTAARTLNPFQNPSIAHKTNLEGTSKVHLEQKMEELIDLDETIRHTLTLEECARIAGGFGVTDDCVATILEEAMQQDNESFKASGNVGHHLQDAVNEGLAAAVRSSDYYTSRQLLILYSLVASKRATVAAEEEEKEKEESKKKQHGQDGNNSSLSRQSSSVLGPVEIPPLPPPPPLDTDRLRSATNSDGLLAVLGAAQVLKAMQDGGAKKRTEEAVLAVDEWVEYGEQSMAFRLASWRDQRAAQGDLKIAVQQDSNFSAFVSNKAVSNRRAFANQLRDAVSQTDFTHVRFLHALHEMLGRMHSPCLRLELLQYVLGLDNRYSVAHVIRSVELAATCLSIAQG